MQCIREVVRQGERGVVGSDVVAEAGSAVGVIAK